MKHLLTTTNAAMLLEGCAMTQQGTVQSPEILIHFAAPTFSKGFEGGGFQEEFEGFLS